MSDRRLRNGILSILVISIIINVVYYFSLNYQPPEYYYLSIIIIYVLFLVVLSLGDRFKSQKDKTIKLLIVFIVFMVVPSYCLYLTQFSTVPDVKDKNSIEAQDILKDNGFIPKVSHVITNNSSGANKVLNQTPSSGLLLTKNNVVTIFVGELESKKVTIYQPKNGDFVQHKITVSGIVENLTNNQKLYVLVQPQPLNGDGPYEWYIQPEPNNPDPDPVEVESDGTWQCDAYIGKNDSATVDIMREFRIVAIVTTEHLTNSSVSFNLPMYNSIDSIIVTRV